MNEFLYVISHLGNFSLSRYPELREMLIKLLLNKAAYYDALKKSIIGLDGVLRYKAASVLLVCFPEKEKESLEIIVRSTFERFSDKHEWVRFCMKLNYSTFMLEYLHSLLDDLFEISRIFALKILYHNKQFKLNQEQLKELISGLLGKADFLDWSAASGDDGIERVAADPQFFDFIRGKLADTSAEVLQNVASCLIYHHHDRLSKKEKAQCWLLHFQASHFGLIEFGEKHTDLIGDHEFEAELEVFEEKLVSIYSGKQILFLPYYNILTGKDDWKNFFLGLIFGRSHPDSHDLDYIYPWLITMGKSSAEIRSQIGSAILELMSYPSVSEERNYNFLLPQLAVLAHEFEKLDSAGIEDVLSKYRITHDEIACSLLARLGETPQNFNSDKTGKSHISLFKKYKPSEVPTDCSFDKLDSILVDAEYIPNDLVLSIESTLLNGTLSEEELEKLGRKGNLGTYFSTVIAFARDLSIKENSFLKADEIGSFKYFSRASTQFHKSILLKIKDIFVSDEKGREAYTQSLIEDIKKGTPRDSIDLFKELFSFRVHFESSLLIKLIDDLLNVTYRMDLDLLHDTCNYIVNIATEEDRKSLSEPLKKRLKSLTNSGESQHEGEFELLTWLISLIIIFIEGKSNLETQSGFLIGLKNVFVQVKGRSYHAIDGRNINFKGRDLFIYSEPIFTKLDKSIIQEIVVNGMSSNIPEIRSLCNILASLAGKSV